VNINVIYHPTNDPGTTLNFGMGPFNATVATQLGIMQDLLLNRDYMLFLTDASRCVDVSPGRSNHQKCAKGLSIDGNQTCTRTVSLNGALELVDSVLTSHLNDNPNADVFLSENQQVYLLEYTEGVAHSYNDVTDCRVFTSAITSYKLCIADIAPSTVVARKFRRMRFTQS
jgi:hypothetical protein